MKISNEVIERLASENEISTKNVRLILKFMIKTITSRAKEDLTYYLYSLALEDFFSNFKASFEGNKFTIRPKTQGEL